MREVGALWNAAERAKRRRDARTGNVVELGLPARPPLWRQAAICRELVRAEIVPLGLCADFAVHAGGAHSPGNDHAHIGFTDRPVGPSGFAPRKDRAINTVGFLKRLRRSAEAIINRHLEAAGLAERVSLRSNRDSGIDREPLPKVSRAAWHLGRRGVVTPEFARLL